MSRTLPYRRPWWTRRRVGLALLLAAVALVAPHLGSGTELVRLRHALVLGPDLSDVSGWTPPSVPADFKTETVAPDPFFVDIAERLRLAGLSDDWQRALAISRHLLGTSPNLGGGAIQRDLRTTYRRIVEDGDGYCGGFVRVYTAIANAAGMTVRPWAFAFDGFGGHGHIWLEIWNRQAGTWQVVDIFQNYHYRLGDGGPPLSMQDLRRALVARDPSLQLRPLHEGVPPGWAIEAKALDYLQRGLDEWYAVWGHNVMSRDAALPVRAVAGLSRSLVGIAAIASGLEPAVRMLATPGNAEQREAMRWLRVRLGGATGLGLAGLLLLLLPARTPAAAAARPNTVASSGWPVVCVVGPLPPPSGGMANQCEQLVRLLREEGAQVRLVRTNAPYRPGWIGRVPILRAGARLLPYLLALWRGIGRAQVVHVFANSGWAWHLLAWPALVVARWRGVPTIVNYRGGQADDFLRRAPRRVLRSLANATLRVTPSTFLLRVFRAHGLDAQVIPNIVDLGRFRARSGSGPAGAPHLIVTRNLEAIYDIPTALRAFRRIRETQPGTHMTIAGSGPELHALQGLAMQLGVADAVRFSGRIDNARIADLYDSADLMLNPSTADNMPISILEALASGVPVVSTDAGGIPDLVEHERTALLVPVGDDAAMAAAALRLLRDHELAVRLQQSGASDVARFAWPAVRAQWRQAYWRAMGVAAREG